MRRVIAVDGMRCDPPSSWVAGRAAWGCYRSHLRLIESALSSGAQSVLILEDDAVCCENFTPRVSAFLAAVPEEWDMIYLGGQHLKASVSPPQRINALVWRPFNVNRTHAYAVHRRMLKTLYAHLLAGERGAGCLIDHHLGSLHETRQYQIFCPPEWLVGQAAGLSNISGQGLPERFWRGVNAEQWRESK